MSLTLKSKVTNVSMITLETLWFHDDMIDMRDILDSRDNSVLSVLACWSNSVINVLSGTKENSSITAREMRNSLGPSVA